MPEIFVNRKQHFIDSKFVTCATLRTLAGVSNDHDIYQDFPEFEDKVLVSETQEIMVKGQERFYSVAKSI